MQRNVILYVIAAPADPARRCCVLLRCGCPCLLLLLLPMPLLLPLLWLLMLVPLWLLMWLLFVVLDFSKL